MNIIEIGQVIISRASQDMQTSAQNIANLTTYGYKGRQIFSDLVDIDAPMPRQPLPSAHIADDLAPGKLTETGNPHDIALTSNGFFVVRSESGALYYTRDGQLQRSADGRLVTPSGMALQSTSGDIVLRGADLSILADGTVLDGEEPIARLLIVDATDAGALDRVGDGLYTAPAETMQALPDAQVRHKWLEASNISAAREMLSMMAALRSAESGQRIIQTYDELMGRALTAFGQL